ncbi:MAG: hypothetical protein RR640_04595 [Oscillospiraceae bacterium]
MDCEKCGNLLRINSSSYRVEGDNSAQEETKAYMVFKLLCENPVCDNKLPIIFEERII